MPGSISSHWWILEADGIASLILLIAIMFHKSVTHYSQRPFKKFTLPILIIVLVVINLAAALTFARSS